MTIKEKMITLREKLGYKEDYPTSISPNRVFNFERLGKDPSLFFLRLGYSCRSRCIHCFTEGKRIVKDLTTNEIKKTVDLIERKGAMVVVSGGEPTDRDDLLEIIKYIKSKGFLVNLETNGIKLSDKEYLKKLNPFIDLTFIPIHSSDPNIHDKITRVPGSWEKTMQGLKNLISSDIFPITTVIINKLNYNHLLSTFDMMQDLDTDQLMSLTFLHSVGPAHSTNVTPRYSEVKSYILPVLKKYGHLIFVHYIPKCILFPYQDLPVSIEKSPRLGTDYVDGRWQKFDFDEIENYSKIKPSSCKECIFDNECHGVWKEYGEVYPELDLIPIKKET